MVLPNLLNGLLRVLLVLGRIPGVIERVKLSLLIQTAGKRLQASHRLCVFGDLHIGFIGTGQDTTSFLSTATTSLTHHYRKKISTCITYE